MPARLTASMSTASKFSPALVSRAREMLERRERALGDAIAAETGTDNPQQRLVAALLASVHRVLAAEATQRSLAGQPHEKICAGRRRGTRLRPARTVPWQLRHSFPAQVANAPAHPDPNLPGT